MNASHYTTPDVALVSWVWLPNPELETETENASPASPLIAPPRRGFDPFKPLRHWLDSIEVRDAKLAHKLCQMIPAQCPFERTFKLFGRTVLYIPPLCKLNPLYEEVVALRFRALCYLADECGEDVSAYC
jgi:hypothetical protein